MRQRHSRLSHHVLFPQTQRATAERRRSVVTQLGERGTRRRPGRGRSCIHSAPGWLAERLTTLFARLASLLWPMSEFGKLKIIGEPTVAAAASAHTRRTGDCGQLEGILHTLVPEQASESPVYVVRRRTRALRCE
jgi:hypothetical protein